MKIFNNRIMQLISAKTNPFIWTSNRTYAAKSLNRIQPNTTRTAPYTEEGLAAFQSRMGISFKDDDVLKAALTHHSFEGEMDQDNSKLQWLGRRAINLYVGEYLEAKYPNLPVEKLQDLAEYSSGVQALSSLARIFGLQFLIRWKIPEGFEDSKIGETKVLGKTLQALVGAIYKDQAAKDALIRYYAKTEKDFSIPSSTEDSESQSTYTPNPLRDTPAYL
ncbi:Ribonuclease 3 [Smittium mucronatum]|uniref:Ribonuclease 3 n=1 Tax=Smittium mucronatum TaxID=133383 RepID=A0A1R0GTX6_9FUNG|nr:Ribonuclease 3 [Smittium mucronatum]